MKVICIENWHFSSLTIGKEYDCKNVKHLLNTSPINKMIILYSIIDDYNVEGYYSKNLFITKEELRDKKLKEIGI